ncbi:unnamed protein product, partial [marine sediment metagenome]
LKHVDSIKVEFFNIGGEEFGFIKPSIETMPYFGDVEVDGKALNSFNLQLLQMIDVKLTSKIRRVVKEIYRPVTMEDVNRYKDYQIATISPTGSWEVPVTNINRFDVWLVRLKQMNNDFLQIAETKSSFAIFVMRDWSDQRRYCFDVNSPDKLCVPILLESVYGDYGDIILSSDTKEIIKQMEKVGD